MKKKKLCGKTGNEQILKVSKYMLFLMVINTLQKNKVEYSNKKLQRLGSCVSKTRARQAMEMREEGRAETIMNERYYIGPCDGLRKAAPLSISKLLPN